MTKLRHIISTGAEGVMERSVKNRFLDYALRAALRLGHARGRNDGI